MDLAPFWFQSADAGYQIDNSLRFRGAQYLTRTYGSVTSTTWTISLWVKYSQKTVNGSTFFSRTVGSSYNYIAINQTHSIRTYRAGTSRDGTAVYRDPSAWYHIVVRTNNDGSNAQVFINNVEDTTATWNAPVAVSDLFDIGATKVAGSSGKTAYFDGYMAEYHYVESYLAPTDFGEYNSAGVWVPKEVSGLTYGTDGFYLDFSDPANIGADRSGNGNNFTATGFELSDVNSPNWDGRGDTPTDNHATLNPILPAVWAQNITDANTESFTSASNGGYASVLTQTVDPTQDFYVEGYFYTNGLDSPNGGAPVALVFVDAKQPQENPTRASTWSFASVHYTKTLPWYGMLWFHYYRGSQQNQPQYFYENGSGTGSGTALTPTSGSCLSSGGYQGGNPNYGNTQPRTGIYYNATNQTITLFGSEYDGTNTQSAVYDISGWNADFVSPWAIVGQSQFQTGFLGGGLIDWFTSPEQWVIQGRPSNVPGLSTDGIPNTAIPKPDNHFNTVLYTGNGGTQSITGVGFQPDLVWIKIRTQSTDHVLQDSVRGSFRYLGSNTNLGENTDSQIDFFRSFDADGFSVAYTASNGSNYFETNLAGNTYAAWCWNAGDGSPVSNTDGTITSTVKANPTAGFSVATYSGNNTSGATFGHGLSSAPEFILVKRRTGSGADWRVYHESIGPTKYLVLNSTSSGEATQSAVWNDTAPSNTVVTLGNESNVNSTGDDYVAYCWHSVVGYSSFGSYQANGSADGPFIFTGFRPAFLMTRATSGGSSWVMYDNRRQTAYNPVQTGLNAAGPGVDANLYDIDFLSNGFKLRTTDTQVNNTGWTYIYMAFAEHPFGGGNVSPSPAR